MSVVLSPSIEKIEKNAGSPVSGGARFALLLACLFALAAVPVFLRLPNHDVAWLLHVAQRVQEGAVLYVDVIEINPPLIVWLKQAPVMIAGVVGCSPMLAFRIGMLALLALSLALSWRLLERLLPDDPRLACHATLLALFVLMVLPGYNFGQREHIMLALVLPYFLATAARWASFPLGIRLACSVGVLAGFGFALKPQFVPIWIALEGYGAWRHGARLWRRPEAVAVALILFVYALSVVAVAPQYFHLLNEFKDVYASFSAKPLSFFLVHATTIFAVWVILAFRLIAPSGAAGELSRGFLVMLLATVAIAAIQAKGFSYHFYPVLAAVYLQGGLLLSQAMKRPSFIPGFAAATLALLLLAGISAAFARETHVLIHPHAELAESQVAEFQSLIEREEPAVPILVLSAHIPHAFPLVNSSGAAWPFRLPSLWLLSGVHASRLSDTEPPVFRPDTAHSAERFVVDALLHDLSRHPPVLLIVDVSPSKPAFRGEPFDFLRFFSGDPRLASLFSEYTPIANIGQFAVYRRDVAQPFN